jgi:hypothetical protein
VEIKAAVVSEIGTERRRAQVTKKWEVRGLCFIFLNPLEVNPSYVIDKCIIFLESTAINEYIYFKSDWCYSLLEGGDIVHTPICS